MRARLLVATLVAASANPASAAAGSVLYVGDSLGVGTTPYLRDELGAVGLDVDAETGRPSTVGVDVLQSKISPDHDVVVFDLGTNDDPASPDTLAADLAAARQIAGDRCMVIATVNRPPVNGVTVAGLNGALEDFAAGDPATVLVDWHAQAERNPGLLADGTHPGPDGYALRAKLFADAIGACLGSPTNLGAGGSHAGRPREGSHAQPLPAPEPEPESPTSVQARGPGGPIHTVASELARAIEVGAEFG